MSAEFFGRCPADARSGPGNQGAGALKVTLLIHVSSFHDRVPQPWTAPGPRRYPKHDCTLPIGEGLFRFDPRLPSLFDGLAFPMQFRGTPLQVTLTADRLALAVHPEGVSRPVRV
jgi:hypothetical protein